MPLSGFGQAEARRIAACLAREPLDQVVSSGLERAEYGAARIRRDRGLDRRDEPALRELARGAWAGRRFADLQPDEAAAWGAWTRDPARQRPPGGESLSDLDERVVPCIDALAGEFAGGTVAIVAHSWVLRVLVARTLGLELGAAVRLDLPTGSLTTVDWPAGGLERGRGGWGTRPVLAAFDADAPPRRDLGWRRGPFAVRPLSAE